MPFTGGCCAVAGAVAVCAPVVGTGVGFGSGTLAAAPDAAPAVTSGAIFSIVFFGTPALARSATDAYGRPAMIFLAVAGPTPGSASSSVCDAVLRFTGAAGAFDCAGFAAAAWPANAGTAAVRTQTKHQDSIFRITIVSWSSDRHRLPGRDVQPLPDLDRVGVRQRVGVGVEDVHVALGVAEIQLGELRQRVAGGHGVDAEHVRTLRLDVGDDLVLPARVGLDVVPQAIRVELKFRLAGDLQLAGVFLDVRVLEPDLVREAEQIVVLV